MLSLADIRRSYTIGPTQLEVLKGVSLDIGDGELLGIVGPSGSGKSTLMNIIGLLDKPTSGAYLVDDRPISYDDDRFLSRLRNQKIGFVFQSYHLLPRLTALENVGLPLVYRGWKTRAIHERAMRYLEKVQMDDRAHHRPSELSGGQQQRVAVARAMSGEPTIILADEPTGALDTRVGAEIMGLFKSLNKEEGITVVIITHDPGIAAQCQRQVEIRDGVLLGD